MFDDQGNIDLEQMATIMRAQSGGSYMPLVLEHYVLPVLREKRTSFVSSGKLEDTMSKLVGEAKYLVSLLEA